LLIALTQGCSAPFLGANVSSPVAPQPSSAAPIAERAAPSVAGTAPEKTPLQPAAHSTDDKPGPVEPNGKEEGARPKQKITLPMAIEMCVKNNFRVLAEAQRIQMAEGDWVTSSLIPNPALFADYQLIPLRSVNPQNQLGPPQADALATFPIDWLLFGKRLAAMHAARLGVEVSGANYENVLRTQLAQTVDAFYEVLMDDAYFKLAEKNLEELQEVEKTVTELAQAKKADGVDLDQIKLAVHEAVLDRHDRELALEVAKARLRPFLGRTAADPDYEIEGALTVSAVVPPPKLEEALALADAHRPDLLSGRKAVDYANAVVELERRRAKPQMGLQPGWTFQNQHYVTGFRNGSMLDVGVVATLPLTDRNQGNIRKAVAAVRERQLSYEGDRADALAEVEVSVASYTDAVEHLTQFNTPETLKAAHDLRKNADAAYRAGNRKLIELLAAQKAYQSRLGHVIEFESTYWRTLNRLNAAVGLKAYDGGAGATQPLPGADKRK
jgi:cobalt-zinc-cadmium efflux system outer membrane protein